MDIEQDEMQFLGLFGIFRESYKIISTWRKIFTQITLTLILPLTFIFLSHIEISVLFRKMLNNELIVEQSQVGSPKYNRSSHLLSTEFTYYWLFKLAYFTLLFIFSLLSTSAVTYTVACVYTARDVTFGKVMSVVPKVWKRLLVTFLCKFCFYFLYNIAAFIIVIILLIWVTDLGTQIILGYIIGVSYLVGLAYLAIIWQLSDVISVLEDLYGIKALAKSRALLKGKMGLSILVILLLNLSLGAIQFGFQRLVVHTTAFGAVGRVAFGSISFLLLFLMFLLGLVVHTVLYFVCKSYHHENIDKSALSDHLDVYLGEYLLLKPKDVQLEHYQV